MEFIPKEVSFAAAKLAEFNRNRFRMETAGATSATASSIVTINLPDAATLDLRTFRVHMDVITNNPLTGGGAREVYGKFAHASDLIANMEVYMGGVQVQQGIGEFNTATRMFKLATTSFDRRHSVDTLLHNDLKNEDEQSNVSVVFIPLIGFFAESATRYIPTSMTGPISVRLTFAPNAVIVPKNTAVDIGAALTAAADVAAAANVTYTASNIYATVDTISMGSAYESMLMQRLQSESFLPVNYAEYYSFNQSSQTGDHTVRFSLSSSSVDTVLSGMRYSNYATTGIIGRKADGYTLNEQYVPNYFYFDSFTANHNAKTKRGDFRFQYSVNNIMHPQFRADALNAACDLSLLTDRPTMDKAGHSVTTLKHFHNGNFVIPLILNLPGNSLNTRTGFNSRGTNTNMELQLSGLTAPTAAAATQIPDSISTIVVAKTTAQLRIGGNRQVAVDR